MLREIGVNILADFVFLVLVGLFAWLAYVPTRRSRLLKFFGVATSRRIVVYLSNLRIMQGGAIGLDGQPRSYQGTAVPLMEMSVASRFRGLFGLPFPALTDRPGVVSKLLLSDVQVELLAAPIQESDLEGDVSLVTLGSPGYNGASRFAERVLNSQARFQSDMTAMQVQDATITDGTYGFVERIIDEQGNRNVFYAAGLSELGTMGAAYFLAAEWARLYRKYKDDRAFVVMLRFEPTDFRRWSTVFEA